MNKPTKPTFQSVELDPMDLRLEAKAIEKGIPTLVTTRPEMPECSATIKMRGQRQSG